MSGTPFSRAAVLGIVVTSAASFALALLLSLFGPELQSIRSAQADSFSRSALGHRAFVELLRRLQVPLLVSRHASGARTGASALLVLLEPRITEGAGSGTEPLDEMIAQSSVTLLVLPKWSGHEDPRRPGWLERVQPLPAATVEGVLRAAGVEASVRRLEGARRPHRFTGPMGEATAELAAPQLVVSEALEPLLANEHGMLLGLWQDEDEDLSLFVLSDPDVLSNHGLAVPGNAELAVRIVEMARDPEAGLVVDETLHGYVGAPALGRELFDFPLVLALIQGLVCVGALLWAGMGRFGAPARVEPPLPSGSASLIDNTAQLLRYGGYSAEVLARYHRDTLRQAAQALHAPAGLRPHELRRWLENIGALRGLAVGVEELASEVEAVEKRKSGQEASAVLCARRIHRWKEGMLRGSRNDTVDR
jgi:hypothetical protein